MIKTSEYVSMVFLDGGWSQIEDSIDVEVSAWGPKRERRFRVTFFRKGAATAVVIERPELYRDAAKVAIVKKSREDQEDPKKARKLVLEKALYRGGLLRMEREEIWRAWLQWEQAPSIGSPAREITVQPTHQRSQGLLRSRRMGGVE